MSQSPEQVAGPHQPMAPAGYHPVQGATLRAEFLARLAMERDGIPVLWHDERGIQVDCILSARGAPATPPEPPPAQAVGSRQSAMLTPLGAPATPRDLHLRRLRHPVELSWHSVGVCSHSIPTQTTTRSLCEEFPLLHMTVKLTLMIHLIHGPPQ